MHFARIFGAFVRCHLQRSMLRARRRTNTAGTDARQRYHAIMPMDPDELRKWAESEAEDCLCYQPPLPPDQMVLRKSCVVLYYIHPNK